jgi:hypothetical protein
MNVWFEKSASQLKSHRHYAAAFAGLFTLGLALAVPVTAGDAKQSLGKIVPADSSIYYSFPERPPSSISVHGNLIQFGGPVGYEHIGIGAVGEGYVLCYGTSRAYDLGSFESGFGPNSQISCSGQKCTMARSTTDRRLLLKQEFVKSKNAAGGRNMRIKMTLTNTSAASIPSIVLRRQVDFDVDTGGPNGTGNFQNWWGTSQVEAVFAWNPPGASVKEGHMLTLRHINKTPSSVRVFPKTTNNILDSTCNPSDITASAPRYGDYGGTLQYNVGTLGANKSFMAEIEYNKT